MDRDPFKEYIKESEPGKRDKGYAWHTAIGLQAVDGLKTSQYLVDTAIRNKTVMHVVALFEKCGRDTIFGRSIVEQVTGLKSSRASEIINLMLENEIIESVKGHGKGKYKFK